MGSSLSPLMGAFYLRELDLRLERCGLFYVRYMDDILIMAKTRWRLKNAIKLLNNEFTILGLCKHPDKTIMCRVEKGFDFLGYRYDLEGIYIAQKSVDNFILKALRLYEQEHVQTRLERLGGYTKRWRRWSRSGLSLSGLQTV